MVSRALGGVSGAPDVRRKQKRSSGAVWVRVLAALRKCRRLNRADVFHIRTTIWTGEQSAAKQSNFFSLAWFPDRREPTECYHEAISNNSPFLECQAVLFTLRVTVVFAVAWGTCVFLLAVADGFSRSTFRVRYNLGSLKMSVTTNGVRVFIRKQLVQQNQTARLRRAACGIGSLRSRNPGQRSTSPVPCRRVARTMSWAAMVRRASERM